MGNCTHHTPKAGEDEQPCKFVQDLFCLFLFSCTNIETLPASDGGGAVSVSRDAGLSVRPQRSAAQRSAADAHCRPTSEAQPVFFLTFLNITVVIE